MLRALTDRERIVHPKIDMLSILRGTEIIVAWCLEEPDISGDVSATRSALGGLKSIVSFRGALGPDGEYEQWISRLRLREAGDTFGSAEIDVRLPYGIDLTAKPEGLEGAYYDGDHAGVSTTYRLDGSSLIAHQLAISTPLGLTSYTVGDLDDCIERGRPDGHGDEWVRFYFGDALSQVTQ